MLFYLRVWTDRAECVLSSTANQEVSPRTILHDAFYSDLCRRYWNEILGPSSPALAGESFDTCSKAVALPLADTQVF